ncbi:alpha/beta-hydrolase [Microthyrium microscopicum]|uniref:Carboxylic ester hydrolase n=1 Tax=Microthyrium microscopicum TaxID=703497 RepID=A0A6A6U877_9PEZI|nr:alpha/beta-hydrolase [Microthyrium microscopicum]
MRLTLVFTTLLGQALSIAPETLTVATSSGSVTGFINSTFPSVRQWLGIPYAQSPTGPLRWAAPVAVSQSSKSLDVKTMPPGCMQTKAENNGPFGSQTQYQFLIEGPVSEDCLTLSVWAPNNASAGEKLPVLVWIHGGGLREGGTSVPYQNGAPWVQRSQAHILVSVQYRLGAFGFPNSAALASGAAGNKGQNFGLLDQRTAVEWVQKNIAGFGGDPAKITLWGQSAGAASVGWYTFAHWENPIARSFIIDSGGASLRMGNAMSTAIGGPFTGLAAHFNCSGAPEKELACLRQVDATRLQAFVATPAAATLNFSPLNDNVTLFKDFGIQSEAKKMAKGPAIYGFNLNEGGTFLCSQTTDLKLRAKAGLTSYFYQYRGNFTNIHPTVGAFHSFELPLVFGTHGIVNGQSTAFEKETSEKMQDLWLAFLKDPEKGLPQAGWKSYNDGAVELLGDSLASVSAKNALVSDIPGYSACK